MRVFSVVEIIATHFSIKRRMMTAEHLDDLCERNFVIEQFVNFLTLVFRQMAVEMAHNESHRVPFLFCLGVTLSFCAYNRFSHNKHYGKCGRI